MFDILSFLFLMLASFGGSFIQRVTGFGYGIFAMMFFPLFFASYGEANILTGMLSIFSSLAVVISMRHYINWKIIFPPAVGCMIATFLAVEFMKGQTDGTLKLLLGVVLILLSVYFFFFASKIHFNPSLPAGLFVGILSGIMNGLFSMGGPPVVIYFMVTAEDDNKKYVATIQSYFLLTNIFSIAVKAGAGYLTKDVLIAWPIGIIGMVVGFWLGKRIFNRLNAQMLKKIVYGFMAISGVINIVTTLVA